MAIVVSSPEGIIELVNPAAARLYGAPAGEFVGKNIAHLYAPSIRKEVEQLSQEVNEEGHLSFESKHVRRDGTIFDVQVTVAAVHDEAGEVSYRVANLQDISKRKKLEARFVQAQKMESLGILAGGIAHDYNNILAVILGNADLALGDLAQSTPARRYVEQIRTASWRAAELVDQVLTYSGKGSFAVSMLNLSELVESTTELLGSMISEHATLRCELSQDPLEFEGDAVQIRQVIMNLITNASDALGDSEGSIVLRTGHKVLEPGALDGSSLSPEPVSGRYVFLEVTDTGGGMDADTKAKIFDPFFSTKFVGRGLGLATVQGIVRGHRGAVHVVSEPGSGTSFTVYLPSADAPVHDEPAPDALDPESAAEPKVMPVSTILVVDDEANVLQVTQRMLEASGHKVLTAVDGKECVALYEERAQSIDIVLLDLTMPRRGREEAFDEIRRIRPDVKAILMSGYNQLEAGERLHRRGFTAFLKKPFTLDELSSQLLKACSADNSSS